MTPVGSCPHIVSKSGETTFVDANGALLEEDTPATAEHGAGARACRCEVTSLAIPKGKESRVVKVASVY